MNYSQYGNRIEVVVRGEGVGGGAPQGAGEKSTEENTEKTWRTTLFGTENPKKIRRFIRVNTTHALAVSRQWANLGINYYMTGLAYQTGDSAYQDISQRQFEVVQDVSNMASSIAIGALYGASSGAPGMLAGALLGASTTGLSTMYKYLNREREYDYKMFKEQNTLEYKRARAGVNLTTGRLR